MGVNELKLEEDLFKEVWEIEKDNCGRVKFKMSDPYLNEAPADRDEEMEAFDISPMALSFEAAGIIGVCSTVIIGNGLLSVLSFRKPSQSYGKYQPSFRRCDGYVYGHHYDAAHGCFVVGVEVEIW